jgi:hypothetical protein
MASRVTRKTVHDQLVQPADAADWLGRIVRIGKTADFSPQIFSTGKPGCASG